MDEKINQPSTPLRAIGEEGKAAIIVDFQESYSAVEGSQNAHVPLVRHYT